MALKLKEILGFGGGDKEPLDKETWPFKSLLNKISSGEKEVNLKEIKKLIKILDNDSIIVPAKKVLILQNLYDQLKIKNNKYKINQQKKGNFNFNQKQKFNYSIESKYQRGFYSMEQGTGNRAIVDFADYDFGGGTLKPNGFAQEEKMMLEGNFILESGKYFNLDKKPLYINGLSTHKFVGEGKEIYGNSKYGSRGKTIDKARINRGNISNYFIKRNNPIESNIIAMAAIKMKGKDNNGKYFKYGKYYKQNFEQMFNTAYSGFLAHKNNGGTEIHTGAWGAGVFGNSENATCVIQILAAQAAGIKLVYHGNKNSYDSAIRLLQQNSGKKYNEIFQEIIDRGHPRKTNSEYWAPNK